MVEEIVSGVTLALLTYLGPKLWQNRAHLTLLRTLLAPRCRMRVSVAVLLRLHDEDRYAKFKLPEVAETFGIKGGLHCHSRWLRQLLECSQLGDSLATKIDYSSTVNPLWLVAHIAGGKKPEAETAALFDWLLDPRYGLTRAPRT